MNKLRQLKVIGEEISKLIHKTDVIAIKISNTNNKRKRDVLFNRLKELNKKKLFLHKLYNTIYNS